MSKGKDSRKAQSDGTTSEVSIFTWRVAPLNTVTLSAIPDLTQTEGTTITYTTDAGGTGTIRYFAFGLPTGLSINPTTGVISGTIPPGVSAYGPYTLLPCCCADPSVLRDLWEDPPPV